MSLILCEWTINKPPCVHSSGLLKFKSYFFVYVLYAGQQRHQEWLSCQKTNLSGGCSLRFILKHFWKRNWIIFLKEVSRILSIVGSFATMIRAGRALGRYLSWIMGDGSNLHPVRWSGGHAGPSNGCEQRHRDRKLYVICWEEPAVPLDEYLVLKKL